MKKPRITDEDLKFFQQAVAGVKKLIPKKIRVPKPKSHFIRTRPDDKNKEIDILELHDAPVVRSEEFITYKHPSISNKTLRKLRKGQYNVDAKLDLHGFTTEEAKKQVQNFLQEALYSNYRVVLIIHGKGRHKDTPVLKSKLNSWLRQLSVVLAFCSAHSAHGSRGAVYVLLKRATREE